MLLDVTFEQIGKFITDNLLWFIIPINIVLVALFVLLIIKVVKNKKKKRGDGKNERKRQNKLPKSR